MAISKKQKIAVLVVTTLVLIFLVGLPVAAGNFATLSPMNSGATGDLYGVWGANGDDVFAVGRSGTIVHYDGFTWDSVSSDNTNDLYGIWGVSSTKVFAAGSAGTIIRYNGSAWSSMSSGTTNDLYSIWGATGTDVFAAGKSGTILYYNGSNWSPMNSGTTNDLQGIWGATATDVLAAGNSGTIIRYNGSTWRSMRSGTTGDLYGIWGAARTDVFVIGQSGTIAHYDGSIWSSMNRNTLNDLQAVWGFSSADVFVTGGSGTILQYVPPAITSISPGQGDQGATLNVTIIGSNLSAASEVQLGAGIAVNSFTVLSSNQLAANITIVAGSAIGARDVSVTTPGGSFTLPTSFTVKQALPTITSVSPGQDRQGATLTVTLTGTSLTGASEVRLGAGIAVNSFTVLSPNQLAVNITLAADAAAGNRDVSVTAPGGSFTLPTSFTVRQALPTITSVSPDRGNQETTSDVTIAGTNLTGATEVRLGTGIAVNSFTVLSSNQLTANISLAVGAVIGARDVSVTTPGGSFTLPTSFTVRQALPTITSVSPDRGSQSATLTVTLAGMNLTGTSEVRLGTGIAVNSFTILNSNQLTANITIVGGAALGAMDVSVTTPGGNFTLPNGFTVKQALPIISSVSPSQGSQNAALTVIISGSNFSGATSVSFGSGVAIESFTNLSPTQLKVNVEIGGEAVTGARDVTVTTPGGSSTLGNSFTIKERSLGTLIVALIWVGVAIIVAFFIIILNLLRQKRAAKL